MTIASNDSKTKARRNIAVLVCASSFLGAQMPIHFTIAGLSGQYLASNPCWATLPVSMTVIASMLSAPIISNIMQRYGRRFGFLLGTFAAALGGFLAMTGLFQQSFALMLMGSFLIGIYMSAQGFYRFAATDTAPPEFQAKAISYVMAGGLFAALFGPQLLNLTRDMFDPVLFAGGYAAIIGINLLGAVIFLFLDIPRPAPPKETDEKGRSYKELLQDPVIIVAMICAMVSYALMNLVMTATPLAVVGCGFSKDSASNVVSAHVIGMFAPSFFTGHLIARYGATRIISIGLMILLIAGVVALNGVEISNFFIALILLGIGWNFGFIGATALLTSAHKPNERGRVQGMNDFAVFGLVTIASLASGGLMNCSGGSPIEGWTTVNLAMVPFLVLAFGALLWLWNHREKLKNASS